MKLQEMLQELIDSGDTQDSIAKELTDRGIPCSQPTIGRILKKGVDPSFSLGDAIRRLHAEKLPDKSVA